jgi:glutamate-1-semialdehyde aminotransferase
MYALRVARARTGKDRVAKFEGGYHGVHDYALVSSILATQMGPPEDPESVPDTPGIPQGAVDQVLTLGYRQPESLEKIRKHSDELAAVIIEPVPSSFPGVDALRPLITSGDALQDLQEKLLIIGTFSGNPVTAAAGIATLEYLRDHPEVYTHIDGLAGRIKQEVHAFCQEQEFSFRLIGQGSWFLPHFVAGEPTQSRDLRGLDNLMRGEILGNYMRYHGVYMPDLHTVFTSAAHTDEDADRIVAAFKTSLVEMREDGLL